jgi:hypothetical protein
MVVAERRPPRRLQILADQLGLGEVKRSPFDGLDHARGHHGIPGRVVIREQRQLVVGDRTSVVPVQVPIAVVSQVHERGLVRRRLHFDA